MEIRTKDYFEKELENILQIHFDAKYYFKDVKYLNKPETTEEAIVIVDNFIIRRIRFSFWRLGIIEIAKLFLKSRNQHYNLLDYIESLIFGYETYPWIQRIKRDKLEEWLKNLNSERIKSIRDKISVQRDNYFAHTDKNPHRKLSSVQLSFSDVDELIKLTESIIFELKVNCLSVHTDFEITGMERVGDILKAFAALKEKRESDLKQERDAFDKKY